MFSRIGRRGLSSLVAVRGPGKVTVQLTKAVPNASLGSLDVSLKMLMSPIHKTDINMVQSADSQGSVFFGAEGLAEVVEVGSGVKSLRSGDWVVPPLGFGCWRNSAVAPEASLMRVPNDIPASYAATMVGDLATAYRLLRDFTSLKKGDVIIQNDAGSSIGLAVVQIAREMGIKTVNVISSSRPEGPQLLRLLTNLGGDINVTDAHVNSHGLNEILSELPPCKLALDGTGGEVVTHMSRCLAPQGTIVSYEGGSDKQAIVVPSEFLESPKSLSMKNFSMRAWYSSKSPVDRAIMLSEIAHMIRCKTLTAFHEVHDFDDIRYALEKAMEPNSIRKVILNLNFPDRLLEHDKLPKESFSVFETTTV